MEDNSIEPTINLNSAVGDGNLTQSLEPESFAMGWSFTIWECPTPLQSDSNSRSCINLPSRTAGSRIKEPCDGLYKMQQKKSSIFITVEGGEGAGKTTLIDGLKVKLIDLSLDVLVTREPGGTALGNQVRKWLLSTEMSFSIDPQAELLLFLAARLQHVEEVIKPALAAGKIVICDRFNDSTIAYQGAGRGLGVDYVKNLCHIVLNGFTPDITFYVDIDPEVGLLRRRGVDKEEAKPGEVDRIEAEKMAFHQAIRECFLRLVKMETNRFFLIDGLKSKEAILEEVFQHIIEKTQTIGNHLC